MTDLDIQLDVPTSTSHNVPRRPGIWRAVSLVAVAAALAISAVSVLQARSASNVEIAEQKEVPLQSSTVSVSDLPTPVGSKIAVLGLDRSKRRDVTGLTTSLDLPRGLPSVVALFDPDDAIVGLAAVGGDAERAVDISPRSTARALMLLTPGVLRPNIEEGLVNVGLIERDAAFDTLVSAIAADSNLSRPNSPVEQAHAQIVDRLEADSPAPDQGCDSVLSRSAYPSTGACAQPKDIGIVISNEQDRWALLFNAANNYAALCAIIAPTGIDGDEILVPTAECEGEALLVAPGRPGTDGDNQATINERVRSASAVTLLYDYVGPFADLVGASAGFADESAIHLRSNSKSIVGSLSGLVATNDEFSDAMDVSQRSSNNLQRHTASVDAARFIIATSDSTDLISTRIQGNSDHLPILDFFERSGEFMVNPQLDWQWDADAFGIVSFGVAS